MKLLELAIQLKTVILFLAQIGPLLKRYDGKIKLYKSVSKLFYRYFLLAFRNYITILAIGKTHVKIPVKIPHRKKSLVPSGNG